MNLNNLNRELRTRSEMQTKRLLEAEGRRLERIALRVWRQYLNSYSPSVYVRTGKTERGIRLGRVKKIGLNEFGIELTFVNDLMYHDSVIDSDRHPQGHALMLISDGWRVKSGKHKDTYRFGYYEGFDYIGQVERAFNLGKPQGITLETQWSGEYLK